MKKVKSIIKGKISLSDFIINNLPEKYEDMTYVEPYCGAINILLNKKKSFVEIINDIDNDVMQIYRALRDEPKEIIRRLNLCKYCEETFLRATKKTQFDDYLDHGVNEFILRRMSRGGFKKAFAIDKVGELNAWETVLKSLPDLAERLEEVYIFNKKAIDVIKSFNSANTLVYCDPPYLHETRVSKQVYKSEISTDDHIELAHCLNHFEGKVMISGYASPLYNKLYKGWNISKKAIVAQKDKEKKVEILFKNF